MKKERVEAPVPGIKHGNTPARENGLRKDDKGATVQKQSSGKAKAVSHAELAKYFHLPIDVAAKELKMCVTVLKKQCRLHGMKRWPHRKLRALDKLAQKLQREGALATDPEFYNTELQSLRDQKKEVMNTGSVKRNGKELIGTGHNSKETQKPNNPGCHTSYPGPYVRSCEPDCADCVGHAHAAPHYFEPGMYGRQGPVMYTSSPYPQYSYCPPSPYGEYGRVYGREHPDTHVGMVMPPGSVPMMGVSYVSSEGHVPNGQYYPPYSYGRTQQMESISHREQPPHCNGCQSSIDHVHSYMQHEQMDNNSSREQAERFRETSQVPPTSMVSNDFASVGRSHEPSVARKRKRRSAASIEKDEKAGPRDDETPSRPPTKADAATTEPEDEDTNENQLIQEQPQQQEPSNKGTRKLQCLANGPTPLVPFKKEESTSMEPSKTEEATSMEPLRPTKKLLARMPPKAISTDSTAEALLSRSQIPGMEQLAVFSSLRITIWTADNDWTVRFCTGPESVAMHGGRIKKGLCLLEGVDDIASKERHPRFEAFFVAKRGTLCKRLYWGEGKKFLQITGPFRDDRGTVIGICGANMQAEDV